MELRTVLFDVADHVATITLDRPQAMNGFNQQMLEEFSRIWDTVKADDDVRVVVLRGAGDRAFCTGMDVKEGIDRHPNVWSQTDPGEYLSPKLNRVWKPLVCAVHGASFELRGGECVAGPCRGDALRAVAVEVRDGAVFLASR